MQITVLELVIVRKLLQEEINRLNKYNLVMYKPYSANLKHIYDIVNTEILNVEGSLKTTHNTIKKYI